MQLDDLVKHAGAGLARLVGEMVGGGRLRLRVFPEGILVWRFRSELHRARLCAWRAESGGTHRAL